MNLWLFSSGDGESNEDADAVLMGHIHNNRPRLAFIPSAYDDADEYYDEFIDRYSPYGYCRFHLLNVDRPFSARQLNKILSADMIYLSGGNTFYFLKHLRKSGFIEHLHRYARRGGLLAGHSAGAIIMTPRIHTASFPEHDRDDNFVGLKDWRGMGLASFEVFPHYTNHWSYVQELEIQTRGLAHPMFGMPDGSAIHLDRNQMTLFGNITVFVNGQKTLINLP